MKRTTLLVWSLLAVLGLAACSGGTSTATPPPPASEAPVSAPAVTPETQEPAEEVELVVFAAASLTETLTEIQSLYQDVAPNVTITFNFDSSGTLKTQIQEGADCDLFLSAAPKQMNQLDGSKDADGGNTEGLDFVLEGTRLDLLENKVTLVVPEGNPKDINSFDDLTGDKLSLIALGNSDVPVGQYSEEILTNLGIWDKLNSEQKITFGTNVKEVTAQVSQGAVDCGIIYATDAFSAGLTIVDEATADLCKQVIYPAAVLNITKHEAEARAFLEYLQSDAAMEVFSSVGFAKAP
ncbi:MAG: molybdate ABC transporter substrate-binding protein [Oscillospiraceae bacterium]|nr:molybdate ABC transporter substrate-binding protein [Oscillospiraceae bacterium]